MALGVKQSRFFNCALNLMRWIGVPFSNLNSGSKLILILYIYAVLYNPHGKSVATIRADNIVRFVIHAVFNGEIAYVVRPNCEQLSRDRHPR